MDRVNTEADKEKDARRLRELFKGRFDHDTSVKLVTELGGLLPAIDFLMNEKEDQVSAFLKQSTTYLQSLREDSQIVASILENKIEDSVRQFVCGACQRSWWKRVPLRKEVSKCRRCHEKYDPLSREHESGLGFFKCNCGNEFTGFATMGETISECYECGAVVPVERMIPPRKNKDGNRRSKHHHSCNGVNCYNPSHSHDQNLVGVSHTGLLPSQNLGSYPGADLDRYPTSSVPIEQPVAGTASARRYKTPASAARTTPGPGGEPWKQADAPPVCVHPKSQKRPIRHVSEKHRSTGSTVSTFLSQDSLETRSVSVVFSLDTIHE